MEQEKINKAIKNGDLIVISRNTLIDAVTQSISHLYQDGGAFNENKNKDRIYFDKLTKKDCKEIGEEVFSYFTDANTVKAGG